MREIYPEKCRLVCIPFLVLFFFKCETVKAKVLPIITILDFAGRAKKDEHFQGGGNRRSHLVPQEH